MADNFATHSRSQTAPAARHQAVVPSDSLDLDPVPRALYCNLSGEAALRDEAGQTVTYSLIAGQILPFRARRVLATGTTASLIAWE